MRALVFSAGGSFGAYQAGVWRALEASGYWPDIVAGASAGALNAAAVARGCPAARLEQWWRGQDPGADVFRWNWPPGGLGLYTNRLLQARIELLSGEFPRVTRAELRVAVTELRGARIRVLQNDSVTTEVLLASCAVPGFFPPVRLDGRWCCDGGMLDPLPLDAAIVAGATEIVAVDVLAAPPSRLIRAVADALRQPQRVPPGIRLHLIAPREPLGRLRDVLRWNPVLTDRWIDAGYRDAMASTAQASSPSIEMAAPR